MNSLGENVLSWNGEGETLLRHHYCANHVLQLTAVKAFSGDVAGGVQGEDNSVSVLKKSRDIVSFFHSSAIATEKLIIAQKLLKPDCTNLH
jgi:hypothetical protein